MMKTWIVTVGLLVVGAGEARSDGFDRQVLGIGRQASAAANQLRQSVAASRSRQQGASALNPDGAFGESQVGLAPEFISIKPGEFMMGSPADEEGRYSDEVQHPVTLTKGFMMQTTAVTQFQYLAIMGRNPSGFGTEENCDKGNFMEVFGRP